MSAPLFTQLSGEEFNKLLTPEDARYLGQVVAQRTGVTQQEAEKRVSDTYAKLKEAETSAREAADKARKASAATGLWLFISMLIGAFTASLCAVYGGRRRDEQLVHGAVA